MAEKADGSVGGFAEGSALAASGGGRTAQAGAGAAVWVSPAYRVQALDCEITAYAPDDEPLF